MRQRRRILKREKRTEKGYPMSEELAGSSGGGGVISYIWILIVTITLALVIYGYWNESRFRGKKRGR